MCEHGLIYNSKNWRFQLLCVCFACFITSYYRQSGFNNSFFLTIREAGMSNIKVPASQFLMKPPSWLTVSHLLPQPHTALPRALTEREISLSVCLSLSF